MTRLSLPALLMLLACGKVDPTFTFEGEVIERTAPTEVIIAHEDIPGFMMAMTMPFTVADAALLEGVDPGDRVAGTLTISGVASTVTALRVTKEAPPAETPPSLPPGASVPEGALFPATEVLLAAGGSLTVGQGQSGRMAVTFVYTRCPIPEFCPLVVTRFQALQAALPEGARLLAITLDPEHDTKSVLAAFAEQSSAVPGKWDFARVPGEVLFGLAEKAGLKTAGKGQGIVHDLVLLILDEQGRLVRRYNDMAFPQEEVVTLLTKPTP